MIFISLAYNLVTSLDPLCCTTNLYYVTVLTLSVIIITDVGHDFHAEYLSVNIYVRENNVWH